MKYPQEIYEVENSREIELAWDDMGFNEVARCDTCKKELTSEDIDKCEDYCIKCWNENERKFADLLQSYKPDIIK